MNNGTFSGNTTRKSETLNEEFKHVFTPFLQLMHIRKPLEVFNVTEAQREAVRFDNINLEDVDVMLAIDDIYSNSAIRLTIILKSCKTIATTFSEFSHEW